MPDGEREYFNQNIGSCEFNIHETGEVVRAIRYNPLYQAWSKMMKYEEVCEAWKDPKVFIKENDKYAKDMKKPVVVRASSGPLSSFNTIILDQDKSYASKKYKGVGYVGDSWVGRIKIDDKEVEVKGLSERQAAVELDNLIDAKGLSLEKQVEWV